MRPPYPDVAQLGFETLACCAIPFEGVRKYPLNIVSLRIVAELILKTCLLPHLAPKHQVLAEHPLAERLYLPKSFEESVVRSKAPAEMSHGDHAAEYHICARRCVSNKSAKGRLRGCGSFDPTDFGPTGF